MAGGRDQEPNWGLAFGSGAFLVVWCLGWVAHVPFEELLMRATVAAVLGALLGVLVGYTISGLKALREEMDNKGSRVDFTVADDEPLPASRPARAEEGETRETVVPQAPAGGDGFQPLDLKAASKHVQSMTQE